MSQINLFGDAVIDDIEDEEYKRPAAIKLFDWVGSINSTKNDLRVNCTDMRGYDAYMVNSCLGQSESTIGFACLMNKLDKIPNEMHYLFLLKGLPKNKSYSSWAKKDKDDRVQLVMDKTGYSVEKAKEMIWVLGDKIEELLIETGGIQTTKNKTKSKKGKK